MSRVAILVHYDCWKCDMCIVVGSFCIYCLANKLYTLSGPILFYF